MSRIVLIAALITSLLGISAQSLATAQKAAASAPEAGSVSQVPLATIGQPKAIIDPSGIKLSVTVNGFRTPRKSEADPPPGGRWGLLDLTITNVGTIPYTLSPADFVLVSPDSTVYLPDGNPNLPFAQLPDTTLAPGESTDGTVVYAIPSGAQLQFVEFRAPGMAQWVIALLPS
jgi:Domain of unknown function (DUF4352)